MIRDATTTHEATIDVTTTLAISDEDATTCDATTCDAMGLVVAAKKGPSRRTRDVRRCCRRWWARS
jgi:hypothetical protein